MDHNQAIARAAVLERLAAYAEAGEFPENRIGVRHPSRPVIGGFAAAFTARAPIFVDDRGVHCAVAHLVAASDPDLVARVRSTCNGAWIGEMPVPELTVWAADNGLTIDEVARIQPSYGPTIIALCDAESPAFEDDIGVAAGSEEVVDVAVREYRVDECFAGCDGPLLLWFAVDNHGGIGVSDVRVEAWVDGASVLLEEDVVLGAGQAALFGPVEFPHDVATADLASVEVRVVAPDDVAVHDDIGTVAGPVGDMGMGVESECEKAGCACDHDGPGGLVFAPILALGVRRRRLEHR